MKPIANTNPSLTRSILSHDQVIEWSEAKGLVHSDSVLCSGTMLDRSVANRGQEGQVAEFQLSVFMQNCWEWTENHLSSSGIFSQDFRHCTFYRRLKMNCKDGKLNHKNLEIVSSSCPCPTTSIGQRRESKRIVFQIQTKSRCTRRDSRKDIGRSLVLETQRSRMETATTNLMENGIPLPHRWYNDS